MEGQFNDRETEQIMAMTMLKNGIRERRGYDPDSVAFRYW